MVEIDGRTIELSNENKVFFPDCGITKGDVVDYYRRIAPSILPHLRGRPVSMQRFPDGIGEAGFFQKDLPDHFPAWFKSAELPKESGSVHYALVEDPASLVYLANQGALTLHAGLSRIDDPDRPDRLIFDLDPSDDDFAKVQQAARAMRQALEAEDLPCFVQTTGSRGLHVVVPLRREAGFDQVRAFAQELTRRLARDDPDALTVEQRKNKRGDRVFLDYLRNAYGQTAVAPYSLRARPGAPCATPLTWEEALAGDMRPDKYGLRNIFRRLAQIEDPWAGIGRHGARLPQ